MSCFFSGFPLNLDGSFYLFVYLLRGGPCVACSKSQTHHLRTNVRQKTKVLKSSCLPGKFTDKSEVVGQVEVDKKGAFFLQFYLNTVVTNKLDMAFHLCTTHYTISKVTQIQVWIPIKGLWPQLTFSFTKGPWLSHPELKSTGK